tara:strand:+ start:168 stop:506 length:339 start_codon:yes stop_codon:yes gene_type:complete
MSIKLTLLKSGETLISEMKELVSEENKQPHAYLLENPHKVETREKTFITEDEKKTGDFGIKVVMIPWIILSEDKTVLIPVDVVTTIVEPIKSVRQMYIDKCETFNIKEESND